MKDQLAITFYNADLYSNSVKLLFNTSKAYNAVHVQAKDIAKASCSIIKISEFKGQPIPTQQACKKLINTIETLDQ